MLATSHIIAGAAVGKAVRRPWVALPIAFLSHFALDAVPHLDTYGIFKGPNGLTTAAIAAAGVDSLVAVALVVWAVGRQHGFGLMYGAAFAAILTDVVFNNPLWGEWFGQWPATAWLSLFHHDAQHNVAPSQWPLGFGTQAVVMAASLWVLRSWKGSEARSEKVILSTREVKK